MWLRVPPFCPFTAIPRRSPTDDRLFVTSRSLISQYCWLRSRTASASDAPAAILGFAPAPYGPITIGAAAVPEPLGHSCPIQLPPALRQIRAPGGKVVAFTLPTVFQAVPGDIPSLV